MPAHRVVEAFHAALHRREPAVYGGDLAPGFVLALRHVLDQAAEGFNLVDEFGVLHRCCCHNLRLPCSKGSGVQVIRVRTAFIPTKKNQ
jgi:hypothetical protein